MSKELKFGFTGYDYNEPADIGAIIEITEKIGKNVTYTEFDTGGTYYDFAIHNNIKVELNSEEEKFLPQFFADVLFADENVSDLEIEKSNGIYKIKIEEFKRYVNALLENDEDEWD